MNKAEIENTKEIKIPNINKRYNILKSGFAAAIAAPAVAVVGIESAEYIRDGGLLSDFAIYKVALPTLAFSIPMAGSYFAVDFLRKRSIENFQKNLDHVGLFRNRLSRLKPLAEDRKERDPKYLAVDQFGFASINKMIEVVSYTNPSTSKVDFLLGKKRDSGYTGAHNIITTEFSFLGDSFRNRLHGVVFEDENKMRGMILGGFYLESESKTSERSTRYIDALRRYGVDMLISSSLSYAGSNYFLSDSGFKAAALSVDDRYEKMMWDTQRLQAAEKYKLTNSEYLRFRLSNQLPDRIMKPKQI